MSSIGFKCRGEDFAFVILDGSRNAPIVLASGFRCVPKGKARSEQLAWLRREVEEVLKNHKLDHAYFKRAESGPNSKTDFARGEFEGVLQEAAMSIFGIPVVSRVKSQIKSDTEFAGAAKDVLTLFSSLGDLTKSRFEEAGVVALCGLE